MLGSNALRSNEVHPPRRMAASQALRSKVSRGKRPCGRFLSRVAGRCAAGDGLIRERRRSLEQTRDAVVADSRGRTYAPLGRRRCGTWAVMDVAFARRLLVVLSILAPQTRSAPLPLVVIGVNVPEDGWAFFDMPIVLILAKIMSLGDAPGFLLVASSVLPIANQGSTRMRATDSLHAD